MEEADTGTSTTLVVDDNEANRALAQNALEDEGHRVILASGGAEAVGTFEREQVDCVVLDVRMPRMDGFVCASASGPRQRAQRRPSCSSRRYETSTRLTMRSA
jgi:CheY-like chemotaxis protein